MEIKKIIIDKKLQDISTLATGRVLQLLTGLISLRLTTTYLNPAEIGKYYLILTLIAFVAMIFTHAVGVYIGRKLLEWHDSKSARIFMKPLFIYLITVSIFASGLYFLLQHFSIIPISISWWMAIWIIFASTIFTSANIIVLSVLNIFEHRKLNVVFTLLTLWIGLLFSFILIAFIGPTAEYWLSGILIGQLLMLIPSLYIFFKVTKTSLDITSTIAAHQLDYKEVWRFSYPLVIGVALYWIQTQSYRFILADQAGLLSLGLFVVGYSIAATVITSFELLFSQYYQPLFYKEIINADLDKQAFAWNKYASLFFPLIVILLVFTIFSAPYLSKILVGQNFQSSYQFILWGALAESIRVMTSSYSWASQSLLKMKMLILPSISGATIAIIGIYVLSKWNPLHGIGLALVLAALVATIHSHIVLRRYLALLFPWKSILISLFLTIPIIVGLLFFDYIIPNPSIIQSILILGIIGIYLLAAQTIIYLKWSKKYQ